MNSVVFILKAMGYFVFITIGLIFVISFILLLKLASFVVLLFGFLYLLIKVLTYDE